MADLFCAFSHWPRRARHAVIWIALLLMLVIGSKSASEPDKRLQSIRWQLVDSGQTRGLLGSTMPRGLPDRPHPGWQGH